jgi:hypothetical protein
LTNGQIAKLKREVQEHRPLGLLDAFAGWSAREEIPPFPVWEARYGKSLQEFSLSTLKVMLVLACLLDLEPDELIRATEIAERVQIHPSVVHRYLATLLALRLVEQNHKTRKYRLVR